VPIIVGQISEQARVRYALVFAEYLRRADCVFVISSDFCHWGTFISTLTARRKVQIHKT
jgi:predicted class III extradiol MEMO1 family dioxygenase